ncbi:MAG: hypothetical protein NT076_03015 [Candidatus Pacearchaeota archaeon]|nr:hypothetical protein [Candidatus Pacearchaeota archaeon]
MAKPAKRCKKKSKFLCFLQATFLSFILHAVNVGHKLSRKELSLHHET